MLLHLTVMMHSFFAGMLPVGTFADMANNFSNNFGNQIGGPLLKDFAIVALFVGGYHLAAYAWGSPQTKPMHIKHCLIAFIIGAALFVGWAFITTMSNGIGQTLQQLIAH